MDERNLRSWSKARSENFEQRAEKRVFLCLSFPKALIPICCAYWTESKHKENTKQADLRGSPKPGTSTEAADCILLEEWYKHSTQPSTIPQNPVFHSYTRCFSQIYTCSLSQLHYFLLHTCTHTFTCTNCLHL
jgi:hypothetical protein